MDFLQTNPEALQVGRLFGAKDYAGPDEQLVNDRSKKQREYFSLPGSHDFDKPDPDGGFHSSLDGELLDSWLAPAHVPERCLGTLSPTPLLRRRPTYPCSTPVLPHD